MSDPLRPVQRAGAPASPGRWRRSIAAMTVTVAVTVMSASFAAAPARATPTPLGPGVLTWAVSAAVPTPAASPAMVSAAGASLGRRAPGLRAPRPRATDRRAIVRPAAWSVENWTAASPSFRQTTGLNQAVVVSAPGAYDGKALRLQLNARPDPGPRQGVTIASTNPAYRYGTYGSRMKSADCRGQDRPGVVTGTFLYSMDHSDANRNGLTDNDEIDFEFLCGQPDVVWMTLWTDYDELRDIPRKISRVVNLRTGKVLYNCYLVSWAKPCEPLLTGENSPAAVTPVAGFNSATQFHTYTFNWQPNRVTFYASDHAGNRILLWDYRGPKVRIPQKPATFMQNVWHTPTWDPFNGPSHQQPTTTTSAYLDSTIVPRSDSCAAPPGAALVRDGRDGQCPAITGEGH